MTALPILGLRADCLESPSVLDIYTIEAMMLWPDDADQRTLALAGALANHATGLPASAPPEMLLAALRVAATAPRREELTAKASDRLFRGSIAGRVLHDAVLSGESLTKVMGDIAKDSTENGRRLNAKTIKNETIWMRFKCVSHFWAAWVRQVHSGDNTFPRSVKNLRTFLEISQAYLRLGQIRGAPRAGFILKDGESVLLPEDIASKLRVIELIPRRVTH